MMRDDKSFLLECLYAAYQEILVCNIKELFYNYGYSTAIIATLHRIIGIDDEEAIELYRIFGDVFNKRLNELE